MCALGSRPPFPPPGLGAPRSSFLLNYDEGTLYGDGDGGIFNGTDRKDHDDNDDVKT